MALFYLCRWSMLCRNSLFMRLRTGALKQLQSLTQEAELQLQTDSLFSTFLLHLFPLNGWRVAFVSIFFPWFNCHSTLHLVLDSVLFHWVLFFSLFRKFGVFFSLHTNIGGVYGDDMCYEALYFLVCAVMRICNILLLVWEENRDSSSSLQVLHCSCQPAFFRTEARLPRFRSPSKADQERVWEDESGAWSTKEAAGTLNIEMSLSKPFLHFFLVMEMLYSIELLDITEIEMELWECHWWVTFARLLMFKVIFDKLVL